MQGFAKLPREIHWLVILPTHIQIHYLDDFLCDCFELYIYKISKANLLKRKWCIISI